MEEVKLDRFEKCGVARSGADEAWPHREGDFAATQKQIAAFWPERTADVFNDSRLGDSVKVNEDVAAKYYVEQAQRANIEAQIEQLKGGHAADDRLDFPTIGTDLDAIFEIFHREDPTRPVTAACDQIAAEPKAVPEEFLDLLDVVGYNYVDRWRDRREKYYSIDRFAHPQRKVIGTESSGMGGIRGDYRWLWPDEAPSFLGYRSNAWLDTEELWKSVRTYDYVSGDFMWAGIDYLGEARWPSRSASSGILNPQLFRNARFVHFRKA